MLRAAALLVILALLAGCIGTDSETSAGETETATPAAADVAATPSVQDAANATAAAPNATGPVATPVSYSGSSPVGVCAWMAGACFYAIEGSEDFHLIEAPGQAKRLTVQVTYSGTMPGTDFYVGVCSGEDEASDCTDYVTGPSPITVDADLSSFPPGTVFGLSVGALVTPATMAATAVFGPADFQVEGAITTVPAA